MSSKKTLFKAFIEACESNRFETVRGFCKEADFDPHQKNFLGLFSAICKGALEVVEVLLDYEFDSIKFKGHEDLLIWLLSDNFKGNWEKRDQVALKLVYKTDFDTECWKNHAYITWKVHGHLYAALKNAPLTFEWLWKKSSEEDKFETLVLFLTQWTSRNKLSDVSYNKLLDHFSSYIDDYPYLRVWCKSTKTFLDVHFIDQSIDDLFENAKTDVRNENLLMIRVLFETKLWKNESTMAHVFALLRFANQKGATKIKEFLSTICPCENDLSKAWPYIVDAVCEMPDLKRKRSDEETTEEKKKRK